MNQTGPQTWLPVFGTWTTKDQMNRFEGLGAPDTGAILLNRTMTDGEIEVGVRFEGPLLQNWDFSSAAAIILSYDSLSSSFLTAGLGGQGAAFAVAQHTPTRGWMFLKTFGEFTNLEPGVEYTLRASMNGQRIGFWVNDVEVIVTQLPSAGTISGQVGLYAQAENIVEFRSLSVRARQPKVFALMDFSEEFDSIYNEVIVPVTRENNCSIRRADEIVGPGLIIQDIVRDIEEASIVIAEVTSRNANVFYELGYAAASKKPVIILTRKTDQRLPFDIAGTRVVFYEDTILGKRVLEEDLRKTLRAIVERQILD